MLADHSEREGVMRVVALQPRPCLRCEALCSQRLHAIRRAQRFGRIFEHGEREARFRLEALERLERKELLAQKLVGRSDVLVERALAIVHHLRLVVFHARIVEQAGNGGVTGPRARGDTPRAQMIVVFSHAYQAEFAGHNASRYVVRVPTDRTEHLVQESDRELKQTVRASARPADARGVLARLLSAFDNRHRRREALALRESTKALKQS